MKEPTEALRKPTDILRKPMEIPTEIKIKESYGSPTKAYGILQMPAEVFGRGIQKTLKAH